MKKHLFIFLLVLTSQNIFSQDWEIQNSGVDARLSHVHFVDKSTGWVTGYDENDERVILKTTDGGKNWISQTFDIAFFGGVLFFIDHTTGWIFNGKSIAKTCDGGETWTTTGINSYEDIIEWNFQFVDHYSGWASVSTLNGGHSSIYKTSDGGATWQTKYDTLSALYNPFRMNRIHSQSFISPDTGWVMFCHQILKTTDGGETWIHQEMNVPAAKDTSQEDHFNQILFVNNRVGWLRRISDILRTEDGGNTWTSFDFDNPHYPPYSVLHFMDEQTGIAEGDSLFLTKNGGESWEYVFHQDSIQIQDVCIVDTENIWAVGERGLIVKLSLEKQTSIDKNEAANLIPATMMLYQNYPNPFNPSTTIYFLLKKTEYVSLKIFNLAGQEVATLINEIRSAGEHHVKWLAEGLPSGIYFVQLQAGEHKSTMKLVFQK